MQLTIPTVERDLVLKQISVDDLNDLGTAALAGAFSGYMSERFEDAEIKTYLNELSALSGGAQQAFDPSHYRRYAGDSRLSRGRYYTIAEDNGADNGTLVRELRAYYSPKHAGITQIFDSINEEDTYVFRRFSLPTPALALIFLPIRDRPNVFASQYSKEPIALAVHLPLRVARKRVRGIVDLRDPMTAKKFTQELSRLEWNVQGSKTKSFVFRPPIDDFCKLIPSLLEQSLGGGSDWYLASKNERTRSYISIGKGRCKRAVQGASSSRIVRVELR
jgi:hypothetical protein